MGDWRNPQTPGIGLTEELTSSEELFVQNLAGLSYAQGDLIYHNGTNLTRLPKGTALQQLRMNAGETAPEWATTTSTPGGSDTQVQFNDGSAFGGDAGLTYDKTTDYLTVVGGIHTPDISILDAAAPGNMTIQGGNATAGDASGSTISIVAGNSFGASAGGAVELFAGTGGDTGSGGTLNLAAGDGGATSGAGGVVQIYAGNAQAGNSNGGDVVLKAGTKAGSGTVGYVKILDPVSSINAILDAASLATADKTFTFPNLSGTFALVDAVQTLTNKTINLTSNTLSGTTAQFNTALSDGDFATLAGSETLTNKVLTAATITTSLVPTASDGAALGSGTNMFSDLFLASGAVVNFNNGDVTLTHAANTLTFGGASSGYQFDAAIAPNTNDGAALGTTALGWADLYLASGGNILVANANAKRTIILSAAGGAPTTTIGCGGPTKVEAGTNDVDYYALEFDTTTEERAFWNVIMPDNYDGGTLTARFIWTNASGLATETVTWGIKARAFADDAAIDQAYGTEVTVADTFLAQGDVHISAATGAITIGGSPAGGQYVVFNVGRKVASDNLTGDARLLAVQIEYGINAYSD